MFTVFTQKKPPHTGRLSFELIIPIKRQLQQEHDCQEQYGLLRVNRSNRSCFGGCYIGRQQ